MSNLRNVFPKSHYDNWQSSKTWNKKENHASPICILRNKPLECITCLMFSLSDGGIISGERLCGGSRPLVSFWLIRWSARANCSRVSFPMSPMSHNSLGTQTNWAYIRVTIDTLGNSYFWWADGSFPPVIVGATAQGNQKGIEASHPCGDKNQCNDVMFCSTCLHALQSSVNPDYYPVTMQTQLLHFNMTLFIYPFYRSE